MRYHFTTVRMVIINKSTNAGEVVEKREPECTVHGNAEVKMELPFDPAILLPGLYPKNPETPTKKNLCTPMFIVAQFTISSTGSNLSAHQQMSGSKDSGTLTVFLIRNKYFIVRNCRTALVI